MSVASEADGGESGAREWGVAELARWRRGDHALGRGRVIPANVIVGDRLQLHVRSAGFGGAEVIGPVAGWGRWEVLARCATPRGTACAFFLYEPGRGDAADELDIEVLPGSGEVMFTAWVAGVRTHHVREPLGFDAAAVYHRYGIERSRECVRFLVDGVVRAEFTGAATLPSARMPLMLNAWWPSWLDAEAAADGAMHVARVRSL